MFTSAVPALPSVSQDKATEIARVLSVNLDPAIAIIGDPFSIGASETSTTGMCVAGEKRQ